MQLFLSVTLGGLKVSLITLYVKVDRNESLRSVAMLVVAKLPMHLTFELDEKLRSNDF